MNDDVTYVVVGRDPRDAMVSMEHHLANMDIDRLLALRELAVSNDDLTRCRLDHHPATIRSSVSVNSWGRRNTRAW